MWSWGNGNPGGNLGELIGWLIKVDNGMTVIEDEGVATGPQRPILNFIGPAVQAVDDPGNNRVNVTVTVPPDVIGVQEEGVSTGPSRPVLNFIGAAITAVDDAGNDRVNITVTVPASTIAVQEEGVSTGPSRPTLNFVGPIIAATDDAGNDRINITLTPTTLSAALNLYKNEVLGTTSGGTTGNTTFSAVLPEMTMTGSPTGGRCILFFSGQFALNSTLLNSDGVEVTFYLDGAEIDTKFRRGEAISGIALNATAVNLVATAFTAPLTGSHTFEVRWRRTGTQATAAFVSTTRNFGVIEVL